VRTMGVVVPVGFAQVSMQFFLTGDAEAMVATVGVDCGTEDNPTTIADEVWTNLTSSGTAYAASSMSDLYTVGPFVASIMTPTGPQIGTGIFSITGENDAVTPPPNNVSWLIQKRTARGGREGRGRMYIPPAELHDGNIDAVGDIFTTIHVRMQACMTGLLLAQDSDGHPLVLLHSEATGPLPPDPITALAAQGKVATQRTRLRR